jgi:hypothetical protein
MAEVKREYSNHICLTPRKETHGISFADFEVLYETSYKNAEIDALINQFVHESIRLGVDFDSLEGVRVWRILCNAKAVIYKFLQLRKSEYPSPYSREHPFLNPYVSINETSALLYAMRRTVESILQIELQKDYAIAGVLKKLDIAANKDHFIGAIPIKKQTLIFFKIINEISNCLKHSLLNEDCNPILDPTTNRFFAVDRVSLNKFDSDFNPKPSNHFFFWSDANLDEVPHIFARIEKLGVVTLEYNVHITQVMVSFMLFMKDYIDFAETNIINRKAI